MFTEEQFCDEIKDEVEVDASWEDGAQWHAEEVKSRYLGLFLVLLEYDFVHLCLNIAYSFLENAPDFFAHL